MLSYRLDTVTVTPNTVKSELKGHYCRVDFQMELISLCKSNLTCFQTCPTSLQISAGIVVALLYFFT